MKTLVIVPAFNEERNIGGVIRQIREVGEEYSVLVVSDGSADRTADIARKEGATVISLPINTGIGGAVQTGFRFAEEQGYDMAVQVDGDGQHPAGSIEKLCQPILSGAADVVIGSRFLDRTGGGYRSSPMRRAGMLILRLTIKALTGLRISDCTSGFRAYSRRAIRLLSHYYPSEYPEPEIIPYLVRNNLRVQEVPVEMLYRKSGRSSIRAVHSAYYMFRVILSMSMMVLGKRKVANMEVQS